MKTQHRFQKSAFILSTLITMSCVTAVATQDLPAEEMTPEKLEYNLSVIQHYKDRYQLDNSNKKLVDNRGNGFEPLYGLRNMRVVLHGVLYRGGGNNYYHRTNKRDNRNPLPEDGLANMCVEGFSAPVYLYSTNFNTATKEPVCKNIFGDNWRMTYHQVGPYNSKDIKALLKIAYDRTQNPDLGPAYFHCWNGWHASGLASAYALRQFCDYTGEQAVQYWDLNTDGNNKDEAYKKIRQQIRDFVPLKEFKIDKATQAAICP